MQRDGGTLEEDVSCVPEHTEFVEGAGNGSAGVACRVGEQANEGRKRCVQCNGPLDGKEQLCSVGGRSIWLHLECEPTTSRPLKNWRACHGEAAPKQGGANTHHPGQ